MKVSKREFYWACSKLIPQILEAARQGVSFNVPEMVSSCATAYLARKVYIPEDEHWIINLAADTVSIIANELSTTASFTFAETDQFSWNVLSAKEQDHFTHVYGELLNSMCPKCSDPSQQRTLHTKCTSMEIKIGQSTLQRVR